MDIVPAGQVQITQLTATNAALTTENAISKQKTERPGGLAKPSAPTAMRRDARPELRLLGMTFLTLCPAATTEITHVPTGTPCSASSVEGATSDSGADAI